MVSELCARGATSDVPALTPSQAQALAEIQTAMSNSRITALMGARGMGKSRVARALVASCGGRLITTQDIFAVTVAADPGLWENAVCQLVIEAFHEHELVILDDYLRLPVMSSDSILRGGFFRLIMEKVFAYADARDRRLVLIGPAPEVWQTAQNYYSNRACAVMLPDFGVADYTALGVAHLGPDRAASINFAAVHRFAGMLNGRQLALALRLLSDCAAPDAAAVIAALQEYVVGSNLRTREVEALTFDSLPGSEGIVEELETHLTIAFEHGDLARSIGLRPKRGVLLYGPPGTGKTSIGRALAHRIKGKFFMIDGSFVSEPPAAFFRRVLAVVEDAKANSPSVLFIDDADVLFGIQHISGLSRYLLSLLDGIESESAANVCVMMTAMDASKIPAALLRSGRIELWLETRLPDADTRARILRRWMSAALPDPDGVDYPLLAHATQGFVAADLRRVIADAKALYATDLTLGQPAHDANFYALSASNELVAARARMAEMLKDPKVAVGHIVPLAQG